MSYIQCRDRAELEEKLDEIKAGFISSDHRIYDTIDFADNEMTWVLDAQTILALADLQSHLEMVMDGMHEMPFDAVERSAKELNKAVKKAMEAIKFKPLTKKQ